MKKITFFITFFTLSFMSAQETVNLVWTNGSGTEQTANATINVGDTVRWTWGNTLGHDLVPTSDEMDAPADFGVFAITAEQGFVYEYTFTEPAIIDYECTPHSSNMFGTITVLEVLSVEESLASCINFYPNPVSNYMIINSKIDVDSYEIYNVLGAKVGEGPGTGIATSLNVSNLQSGMYYVTVISGDISTTKRMIKK